MPLMISEIGIRMAVGEPITAPDSGSTADDHNATVALNSRELDALVRRCVEDVLLTLRMQEGR